MNNIVVYRVGSVFRSLVIASSLLFAMVSSAAEAPLTLRFGTTALGGDIELIGNAIVTCDTTQQACLDALDVGQPSNSFAMEYIDVDGDGNTFNSSNANLNLPAGSTILYAGLYWAGTTEGSIAPPGTITDIKLATPISGGYLPLSGTILGDTTTNDDSYAAFVDVTAEVQAGGGGTYTVADLQVSTGTGSSGPWGGWAMAVAYADPASSQCRNVNVFDGYENFFFTSESVTISGFEASNTAPVGADIGFFMGDGDVQNTDPNDANDSLIFEGTTVSGGVNPATNFFNNTVSIHGANVAGRSPNPVHNLVVDIDSVSVDGLLAPGSTSAVITIDSQEGLWWPMMTAAIDTICPDLTVVKSSESSSAGESLSPGDVISYTIEVTNDAAADTAASELVVVDNLPAGVSYVPGSAQKTYFVSSTGTYTSPALGPNSFDIGGTTQSLNTTGLIPAGSTLQSLAYTTTGTTSDWLSDIGLQVTYPSGTAYNETAGDFGGDNAGAWNISRGPDGFTGPAEGVYSFDWSDGFDGVGGNDNSVNATTFTITYGGVRSQVTDAANAPPNMIDASENIMVAPNESIVITFQVVVDDPLDPSITDIVNQVEVKSKETPVSITDTATDSVVTPPGNISGTIWLDVDGDGVNDNGEVGVAGVTVFLCASEVSPCNAGNAIATRITDANGEYDFDRLRSGDYQVQVDNAELSTGNLNGLSETSGNLAGNTGALTVVAGETTEADLGYLPEAGTGVVEGTVWTDTDGDGEQGSDEVGISGVTVLLCPATDPSCALSTPVTATTGPDGSYILIGVAAGEYVVSTDPATVPSGYNATTPTSSEPISVSPNEVVSNITFGYNSVNTHTVSDLIWLDTDGDGILDPSEEGIGMVTVDLVDCGADGVCGTADDVGVVATVSTNADGSFEFTGVADGNYQLQVSDNNGVLNTLEETTSTAGLVDVNVSGTDVDNTASPSFGYNEPGTISGNVFSDSNSDAQYDANEAGILVDALGNPIVIELLDGTCTPGVSCLTATVKADGSYRFGNIDAGSYSVGIVNPPAGAATTLELFPVTLSAAGSVTGIDFGYNNPGLDDISGTIFEDLDSDGTYEANGTDGDPLSTNDNEPGIAEVTLELIDCGAGTCFDGDEVVVATTTAAADGSYSFTDVPDGNYIVEVTDDDNVLDGMDPTSGLDQQSVSTDSSVAGNPDAVDFGYVGDAQTASVSSGVWIDANGDGIHNPGETPIANVDIDLIDCGADRLCGTADDVVIATATTDTQGNVIFPNLPPGNYQLDIDESDPDLPAGYVETSYTGINPNDSIALSEGESYEADFGYASDPAEGAVSGKLWSDADADGIRDAGEAPLAGITVTLYDSDGNMVATTTTAADGSYEFTGLAPCPPTTDWCYLIDYDESQVDATGLNGQEPTNTSDSDNNGMNDTSYLVDINEGEVLTNLDFGFAGPDDPLCMVEPCDPTVSDQAGSIEGYVYFEPAAGTPNGVLDNSTDSGIEQVSLNLLDSGGNIIATTTTADGSSDANGDGVVNAADIGYYNFAGILPGSGYQVVVSDTGNSLAGFNPSGDPDEAGLCVTCDGTDSGITVTANSTERSDFGYMGEQVLGNIGSLIWFDTVDDGVFNPYDGDSGLAGVTVQCWLDTDGNNVFGDGSFNPNGVDNLVRTVTTDSKGEYYCEGLPTGTYFVIVTDTAGVLAGFSSATVQGGSGALSDEDESNKVDITVPHAWRIVTGSDNLTADFAVRGALSISGNVFIEDADLDEPNDDGVLADTELDATPGDGDDSPAQGVTVILLRELDDGTFVEFSTVLTDANGDYVFDALPPGNYKVVVDPTGSEIDGFGQTADPDLAGAALLEDRVCDSNTAASCDNETVLTLGSGDVSNVNFGYQTGFTTTPVTVNWFQSETQSGGVLFSWEASNEVGHLGYQIYARIEDEWQLVTPDLIRHDSSVDAMQLHRYEYFVAQLDTDWFALVDVSTAEDVTPHGPYRRGSTYGGHIEAPSEFDWGQIQVRKKPDQRQVESSVQQRLNRLMQADERAQRQQIQQ